jgi:hypothetical protein
MQMTELFVINIDSGGPQKQEILARGGIFALQEQQATNNKSQIFH